MNVERLTIADETAKGLSFKRTDRIGILTQVNNYPIPQKYDETYNRSGRT